MREISKEERNRILEDHELWLKGEGGKRANLSDTNLYNAILEGANLKCAILEGANLKGANLNNADLTNADLTNANLSFAELNNTNLKCVDLRFVNLEFTDLKYANLICVNLNNSDLTNTDLRYSDLSHADLRQVNLEYADLRYVNLSNANLSYTNLKYANLRYTNLENANLCDVNLRCADLRGANLKNVRTNIRTIGYDLACPEKGSFIGYKKANGCIVELLILEDAKRCSATTIKCRTNKAKVLDIENIKTGEKVNSVCSNFDNTFIYKVGEIVSVDNFDDDRWNECSAGIHFFVNRERAIDY